MPSPLVTVTMTLSAVRTVVVWILITLQDNILPSTPTCALAVAPLTGRDDVAPLRSSRLRCNRFGRI
jgi:hypothetical protein